MGNNVAVEKEPKVLDELLEKPTGNESRSTNCFNSILRVWSFSADKNDPHFIENRPVPLENFQGFEKSYCYIILHMYRTNQIESLDPPSQPTSNTCKPANILQIAQSTSNLSPRGQANCFGGFHSASGIVNPSSPGTDSKYDIYIWNGTEASQFIRANCLAKVFVLDGALKEGKCLDFLAFNNSTIIPLSSLFLFDKSFGRDDWSVLLKSNHLIRTMNQAYHFVEDPQPKKRKEIPKLEHAMSTHNHAAMTNVKTKKRKSSKTKKNQRDTKSTRDKAKLPQFSKVPPIAFPTDKVSYRSISLPASKIEELKNEDFRIDMAAIDTDISSEMVPPESKARKIARYDKICSKITDNLYIGSDTIARDVETLKRCGVTHILNCAGVICENYFPDEFVYKKLYLYDGSTDRADCLFYNVLEFMDDAISKDGVVFVHCHQGISRSSAMLILYLMWKENRPFISAHEFVKARREVCNPNAGFTCQLLDWWNARKFEEKPMRIFIVTPHRKECPDTPALRELSDIPKFLDPRGCYIMFNQEKLFSWRGQENHMFVRKSARRFVKLLQRFDNAPSQVSRQVQGEETEEFSKIFPSLVLPENIQYNSEYNQYFDLLALLPGKKKKANSQTHV